MKIWRCNFL